jgi:hypothetical protein
MAGQAGFFDGEKRLKALSATGDPLDRRARVIEFEVFPLIWNGCRIRTGARAGGRTTTRY